MTRSLEVSETSLQKSSILEVWAVLPGSTIEGLEEHVYRADYDIYAAGTKYRQIHRDLQAFVSANPSDPFVEFGYYTLGDFDRAIQARPDSPIKDVLHHAIGFKIVGTIVRDAFLLAKSRAGYKITGVNTTDWQLTFLNRHAELFDGKPLADFVSRFAERAAAAQPHFEIVLRNPKAPLADDAAYMLGWLAYHQGQYEQALTYFIQGMKVGNGDYKLGGEVKQTVRIFERSPARRQYKFLETNNVLAEQTPLWYVAARSAYRDLDYGLTTEIAQVALKRVNISPDSLPVTTDPKRIDRALERNEQLRIDSKGLLHVGETAYLLAASREHQQYLTYLSSIGRESPERATARTKAVIVKYSIMLDSGRVPQTPAHKDLRQAAHLIEATLASLPKDQKFDALREWLHYRKVRILAVFAPRTVGEAVAAMEKDVPTSKLLDDALSEQIYAEGYMLGDLSAAQKSFTTLMTKYPNGNAVDNAYSWMAIAFRCAGQLDQAQAMNKEIIRRFPLTRHAVHARERIADPSASRGCYYRWREEDD